MGIETIIIVFGIVAAIAVWAIVKKSKTGKGVDQSSSAKPNRNP